jgi:hypothetical protein
MTATKKASYAEIAGKNTKQRGSAKTKSSRYTTAINVEQLITLKTPLSSTAIKVYSNKTSRGTKR